MEVNNVPKIVTRKAEESQKVKVPSRPGVDAYASTKSQDSADISSKGRTLLNLREKYSKLSDERKPADIQQVKEKIDQGVHKLSSEEIVASILKGTLFDVI